MYKKGYGIYQEAHAQELDQDQLVGELLSLYKEARSNGAYSAAARCLGMVAQMTGLDEPEPKPNPAVARLFEALNARLPLPAPAKSLGDGS